MSSSMRDAFAGVSLKPGQQIGPVHQQILRSLERATKEDRIRADRRRARKHIPPSRGV